MRALFKTAFLMSDRFIQEQNTELWDVQCSAPTLFGALFDGQTEKKHTIVSKI